MSRVFPDGCEPGPGRVLSSFSAAARLGVILEKVMDCRVMFATSEKKNAAVVSIDAICRRWKDMLPEHMLKRNDDRSVPMNIAAVLALYYRYTGCISSKMPVLNLEISHIVA